MRPHRSLQLVFALIAFPLCIGPATAQTLLPNDLQPGQWGLHNTGQAGGTTDVDIDAPEAWSHRSGAPEIIIAVLSTGIDLHHPDLSDNLWVNPDEIGGNGVDDDDNGVVDDVHGANFSDFNGDPSDVRFEGTHIAGILGAVGDNGVGVSGAAWSVRIMALRVTDVYGRTNYYRISMAAKYAADKGADIILLPRGDFDFGFFPDEYLQMLVDAATDSLLVVPVGDAGSELTEAQLEKFLMLQPWESSIRVTAIDRTGALWPQANRADGLADVAAPGVDILSSVPSVSNTSMDDLGVATEYDTLSGSAQAAAHVAGALALLMAERPELPKTHCKSQLLAAADRFESLEPIVFGGRRLNAIRPLTEDHDAEINLPPSITIIDPPFVIDLDEAYTLDASFTDDPFQLPIGGWTVQWEQVAGPPNPQGGEYQAEFLNPDAAALEFSCQYPGPYTFRLNVDDGYAVGTAEISVYVRHDPEVNPGPTLHWRLDGSFADASGNGNDGTAIEGSPGFITVPVLGETGAFSYGDTVETELYTGGAPIWSLAFWIRSEGYDRLHIRFEDAFYISFRDRPILYQEVATGGSSFSGLANSAPEDVWAHIGITCDGESLRWWVNGSLLGSTQDDEWRKVSDLRLAPGISRLRLEYPEDGRKVLQVPIDDLRVHVGYCMIESDFAAIVDPIVAADTPVMVETPPSWRVEMPGQYTIHANIIDNGFPGQTPLIEWTINEPATNASFTDASIAEPLLKLKDFGSWNLHLSADDGWHTATAEMNVACQPRAAFTPQVHFLHSQLNLAKPRLHPTKPLIFFLNSLGFLQQYNYETGEIAPLLDQGPAASSFDIDPNGRFLLLVQTIEFDGNLKLKKLYLDDLTLEDIPYPHHLPKNLSSSLPRIGIGLNGKAYLSPHLFEFDCANHNLRLRYDLAGSIPDWNDRYLHGEIRASTDRSRLFFLGAAVIDAAADQVIGYDGPRNYTPTYYSLSADGSRVATLHSANNSRVFCLNTPDFKQPIILRDEYDYTPVFHPQAPILFTYRYESDRPWLVAFDTEQLRPAFKLMLPASLQPPDSGRVPKILIHPDGERAFINNRGTLLDIVLPALNEISSVEAVQDYSSVNLAEANPILPNCLANDRFDGFGEPPELKAELLLGPIGAAHFQLHSDGSYEYQPAPGFVGLDRFLYRCSADGSVDDAIAYVEVTSPDHPEFLFPVESVGTDLIVDMVLDDQRNILYYTMNDEEIRRIDLTNRRLLPPLGPVSAGCRLDISPDGRFLYGVSSLKPIYGRAHCLVNTETGFVQPVPAQAFMADSERAFFLNNSTVRLATGGHLFHIDGMYWTTELGAQERTIQWAGRARDHSCIIGFDPNAAWGYRQDSATLVIEGFPISEPMAGQTIYVNADGTQWATRYTLFSPAVSPISTQPAPCDWAFHATPDRPAIARGEYSLDMSLVHTETGALINQVSSQYASPFSSTPMIVTEPLPPLVTADGHWSIHAVNQGILLVPIPESTQIRMPRPVPDLYFLAPGETLDIDAAHGLLANDWYLPEPGEVTVVLDESYPVNGLQVAQDGSLKFAPSSSFDNVAEFSYRIEGPAGVTQPCLVRITPRDPADDGLFVLPVANCTGAILNTPRNLLHWVDEQGGIYSMELESGRITLERDTNLPLASIEISPDGNTCYCISGELAPGRGTLLVLNLDTGLLRRLPLSGEPVELELLVGQRLAVMADGTCFAGLRTLDLQTGRLSEPVFPLAPAWHQKGEVLRSNDHKLFTVHNNENSCSWTDGTISLHHKVVYAGDPDLGILLAWNGELLDLDGGVIDLPPNLTPSSVSIARLHAASESLIVCSEDGISLYPLGSHTAAFSNGFGVRRDELRMMDTGGQSPHAVLLLDDGRPLKLFSAPAPPVNPMLFPKDDSFHVAPDIDLTLDSQALLINDLFPIEPQPHIILTATPVHGTIIGAEMGSPLPNPIVYRPEPAFTGTDSFHYRLTTGTMPSDEEAVVHLRIDSEPICSEQLPIHNPTDLAFDPVREILYVATPAGVVRYSVKQNRFLPTLAPKEAFSTLDVNPDLNQLFALRNGLPHMRVWDLNQPDESQTVKVPGAHSLLDVAVVDSDWGLFSTLSPDTANHACFQFPTDLPEAFSDQGIEPGFEAKILVDPSSNSAAAIHNYGIRLWESPTSSRAFALSVGTSIGQHGRSAFDQTKGLIVYEGGAFRYDGAFLGRIADLSAETDEMDLSGGVLLHPSMNLLVALSSEYDRLLLLDTATWALLQSTDLGFDVWPYQFVGRQGSEMALNPARNQVYITQPEGITIVPLFGDSQITVAFDRVNDPGAVLTPASPILSVTPNTAIQIEAEPSAGYGFGHWSVTPDSAGLIDDPDAEQTVVTMLRSGTVQAHFIDGTQACIPTFHVNHPEWGSAGPAQPWTNPPIHGTTIDITAQPIEGMAFLGWVTTDGGILEDPTSAVTQLTLVGEPVVTAFFGPAIPYCPYPTSILSGTGLQPIDFNEDGYQEGVGFGSGAPNLIFFDSDQACGFVPSQRTISFPPDLRISSIRAHDFNQDGHGDILVWFSNESFAFWLNPGLGGYPDSAESFQMQQTPVAPHFETFLVGDFNGDGADDLYIYPTGTVHLLQGNSFAEGTPVSPKLGNPTTADFNADGHLDLIGLDGEELAVFLNDGNLNFERIELSVGEISSENSIQVGSINGDPYPDLFLGRWKTIQLFLGLGNGTFSPLPTALPYPIRGFGLIDMEDNGSSDILIWEEHDGTLRLLLNDGSGNFNKPGIVFGPNLSDQPRPLPVDFNRDGDLDLFMNQGIWLFDSVRTFEVIPGIMVNTDPPGTVVGTLTATISDQPGPYTFELLPDYSNDTEHFDLIGDQLILKTSFETDIPISISLAFRISNAGGMVGSGYFGTTLEIDPASSLRLDPPVARYFYGVGNKDHLPVGIHGLEIASSALELPITYRYAQGIGDRDNGRFELIPARYERAQMLFAPPAFPPRWSSFRIAAEVLETQPPMRGEAIIQFLEATHFGGPYTFDVYHLLNLAAITRLELNQPPTHGTAEIQGPTILYTPPSDKTPREDGFYYTVEDDDGNTHLVQAVIGFDFDFDMDGLLDRYEGEQFGSSYTAWDTDLDGIDDGMEYLTGSDPLDPTKWFRIEAMETAGASVELTFTGSPDRRYSVQQLIDGTWSTIPGFDRIPGTAPEPTIATIPTPPATEAFFRLIVHTP